MSDQHRELSYRDDVPEFNVSDFKIFPLLVGAVIMALALGIIFAAMSGSLF